MSKDYHRMLLRGSVFLVVVACAPRVESTNIELRRYAPAFTADLSAYKGLRVCLMNVDNQAGDTSIGYYYSPDKQFAYAGDSSLRNYFWYAFEKALVSLGMAVSNTGRSLPVHRLCGLR